MQIEHYRKVRLITDIPGGLSHKTLPLQWNRVGNRTSHMSYMLPKILNMNSHDPFEGNAQSTQRSDDAGQSQNNCAKKTVIPVSFNCNRR